MQELGIHENIEITQFISQLMAIPFLPASLISPIFTFLEIPNLSTMESMKLENLIKYVFQKTLDASNTGFLNPGSRMLLFRD